MLRLLLVLFTSLLTATSLPKLAVGGNREIDHDQVIYNKSSDDISVLYILVALIVRWIASVKYATVCYLC